MYDGGLVAINRLSRPVIACLSIFVIPSDMQEMERIQAQHPGGFHLFVSHDALMYNVEQQ